MARRFEFENQDIVLNLKFPAEAYPGVGDNEFNLAEIQKTNSDWDIIRINNEVNGVSRLTGDRSWPVKYLVDFSQFEEFRKTQ
ncbi:MAG: hypothetical protein HC905_14595 [Bacteroidales bacterium]|nr:hypothetical protein [Bacteroidales bacterium]